MLGVVGADEGDGESLIVEGIGHITLYGRLKAFLEKGSWKE